MTKLIVEQSPPLKGKVKVDGAKNSVLPILAASLLAKGCSTIEEIPDLEDVKVMYRLLASLGAEIEEKGYKKVTVDATHICKHETPYELVNQMRASFLIMGPLLARLGRTKICLPGGCAIGSRPVDLHLKGFQALGAVITQDHGFLEAVAAKLIGTKIYLDFPSVGATENIMMAATLAVGITVIENPAIEPEIVDLANYLNAMGAKIRGAGTDTIKIEGVAELKGTTHAVIPDRIEAGTYMVAAAITKGDILIENAVADHLKPVIAKLREIGVEIEEKEEGIRAIGSKPFKPVDIKTLPYPGFPTDMQAQFMALMSVTQGTSIMIETVFENRYMHVPEFKRMGANVRIEGRSAVIDGVEKLSGAQVRATDLRAGAALILCGLIAEGRTEILDIRHIDRGYSKIEEKLQQLGGKIYRVEDKQ